MTLKIKMNKKATMSISIVLLVLATLILSIFALFTFNLRDNEAREIVSYASYLEGIYAREEIINFYIQGIIDDIEVKNKEEFISKFKQELGKYKDKQGDYLLSELSQVEEQIKEENIDIAEGKLKITFNIEIEKNTENLDVAYAYKKSFEKELS